MLDWLALRMHVSTTVAALVVVLIVVQLATQFYALVDLARRDTVRGGPKWLWVLIIAFGNLVGAIAYLAVGRKVPTAPASDGGAAAAGSDAARRAVDALYGPRDQR
jgi:phospholipase D-like protein